MHTLLHNTGTTYNLLEFIIKNVLYVVNLLRETTQVLCLFVSTVPPVGGVEPNRANNVVDLSFVHHILLQHYLYSSVPKTI